MPFAADADAASATLGGLLWEVIRLQERLLDQHVARARSYDFFALWETWGVQFHDEYSSAFSDTRLGGPRHALAQGWAKLACKGSVPAAARFTHTDSSKAQTITTLQLS